MTTKTKWSMEVDHRILTARAKTLIGGLHAGAVIHTYQGDEAKRWQPALDELKRFGLADTPWVKDAGTWVPVLTEAGEQVYSEIKLSPVYGPVCCEAAVQQFCVCRYASSCFFAHEGNGCHGSHD